MQVIEMRKIAALAIITFLPKAFCFFVVRYVSPVYETLLWTMGYLKMFDPLWGDNFGSCFEGGEGKLTTSIVSQEPQMIWNLFIVWNYDTCHGYRTTKNIYKNEFSDFFNFWWRHQISSKLSVLLNILAFWFYKLSLYLYWSKLLRS